MKRTGRARRARCVLRAAKTRRDTRIIGALSGVEINRVILTLNLRGKEPPRPAHPVTRDGTRLASTLPGKAVAEWAGRGRPGHALPGSAACAPAHFSDLVTQGRQVRCSICISLSSPPRSEATESIAKFQGILKKAFKK